MDEGKAADEQPTHDASDEKNSILEAKTEEKKRPTTFKAESRVSLVPTVKVNANAARAGKNGTEANIEDESVATAW